MGFFDKLKEKVNQFKEENKNFGRTMGRINDSKTFYGNVNRAIKGGDFWQGSYVSILEVDGKQAGVIYSSTTDDYVFTKEDITSYEMVGVGDPIKQGNNTLVSAGCIVTFKDGKKAQMDIIAEKLPAFKMQFNL